MFEDFLDNKDSWLNQGDSSLRVVFSSRLRLARNLDNFPFPLQLDEAAAGDLLASFKDLSFFPEKGKGFSFVEMAKLNNLDKDFLLERHLISQHFLSSQRGGLILSSDERVSAMINEEDHLRLQVVESGYNLDKAWSRLNKLDDCLSSHFNYAFLPDLGYLTSCPTNVGTALRASCMLHLPGLILTKKIEKILNFLTKISFAIRGLFGEGSQALGNFFQISNQISLGVKEEELIDNLARVVMQVSQHELDARQTLAKKFKINLEDIVWRALGTMRSSRLIGCKEALRHLSTLSLGVDLGIIKEINREAVNGLFIKIQPAHLQKREGKFLNQRERDYLRSELLREELK